MGLYANKPPPKETIDESLARKELEKQMEEAKKQR